MPKRDTPTEALVESVVSDPRPSGWDHSSDQRFTDVYARASASEEAHRQCRRLRDAILRLREREASTGCDVLDVLDVGCNAGTMAGVWADLGHRAHGLDVNQPLLEIAKARASEQQLSIDYQLGSATDLPWDDASMDVCTASGVLEHIEDWRACINEMIRVLKPGGTICITTTNVYCPVQDEFRLPLYSWYPPALKRRCVAAATSTRPELANYARYPAVHWFSYFQLRRFIEPQGLICFDRYDVADLAAANVFKRGAVALIRALPVMRRLAYVATNGTILFASKRTTRA